MAEREERGSVQAAILEYLANGDPTRRYTPAIIANELDYQQGTAYAAVRRLALTNRVKVYGTRPLMVGPLPRG